LLPASRHASPGWILDALRSAHPRRAGLNPGEVPGLTEMPRQQPAASQYTGIP
jgi:hypothetical protein